MTNLTAPHFTNEDKAREHLEALRWPDGPVCPHCGSFGAKRLPAQRGRPTKAHPEGAIRNGVIQCNRSEEHASELQSLMRSSYAVCCLKKTRDIDPTRDGTRRPGQT